MPASRAEGYGHGTFTPHPRYARNPVTKSLDSKGVNFGHITANADGTVDTTEIKGLDADLVIKPFHQAGRVISLREFTNNAMNHHHGMQAEERFDLLPEKGPDFDEDGITNELSIGDITAVTLYQAALGVPGQLLPDDPQARAQVEKGEGMFASLGCTSCHVPTLPLNSRIFVEPNPFNRPGDWKDASMSISFDMTTTGEGPYLEPLNEGAAVRAYTDLKRHNLCDDDIQHYCNEVLSQGRIDQDGQPGAHFFLTRKLWDVGNSAPFGHAGDLTTITEAILMHGGEARATRDAFVALDTQDQRAVVSFLKSLQVLPKGSERVMTESQLAAAQNAPGAPASITSVPQNPQTVFVTYGLLLIAVLVAGFFLGRRISFGKS